MELDAALIIDQLRAQNSDLSLQLAVANAKIIALQAAPAPDQLANPADPKPAEA